MNTNEHPSSLVSTKRPIHAFSLVRILSILLILAVVFWAGMEVGYRKAEFSYRFSTNYMRTFGDRPLMIPGAMMGITDTDDLIGGHGAAGKVISLSLPSIIVSDRDGTEKNILVTSDTIIRSARSTTASTSIRTDDFIVVIGTPNDTGGITAKLIRIMPMGTTPSSPVPTPPGSFNGERGPNMMYGSVR